MFQLLYTGASKELNIIFLLLLTIVSHLSVWGIVWSSRRKLEQSTFFYFKRGIFFLLTLSILVLFTSAILSDVSSGFGFQLVALVATITVVFYTLLTIGQTLLERTLSYNVSLISMVVAVLLIPALFTGKVPFVVQATTISVLLSVSCLSLGITFLRLKAIAKGPRGTLSNFRARRIVRVLACAIGLGLFVVACTPFTLYATPVESISTILCSSLACVSGIHVATERVGYLVEYARFHLPQLDHASPLELERIARSTVNSARTLSIQSTDPKILLADVKSGSNREQYNNSRDASVIESILRQTDIEADIVRSLLRVEAGALQQFSYSDFQRILIPHAQFGREMTGEYFVGMSDKLMSVISKLHSAAIENLPMIIIGEPGVGKRFFARLYLRFRGVPPSHVLIMEGVSPKNVDSCYKATTSAAAKGVSPLLLVEVIDGLNAEEVSMVKEALLSNPNTHNFVLLSENQPHEKAIGSYQSRSHSAVSETVLLNPLRERSQDILCQAIWFLYTEAEALYGKDFARELIIPSEVLLESLTHSWNGNTAELKDAIRAALSVSYSENSTIHSIVPFNGRDDRATIADWLAQGLRTHLLESPNMMSDTEELTKILHVSPQFAAKLAKARTTEYLS